jgi:hypothetical protein
MIQKFNIESIKTVNKPGELCPFNIHEISKKLGINFKINNLFYITDLNSIKSRGNHANTNTSEIIICISGSFDIECFDGKEKFNYNLKKNEALYIPNMIWLSFYNFKECILLVLTSITPIIEKESIYDIEEFKKIVNSINRIY